MTRANKDFPTISTVSILDFLVNLITLYFLRLQVLKYSDYLGNHLSFTSPQKRKFLSSHL